MQKFVIDLVEAKPRAMLDYTYMNKYSVDAGFKVCVDVVHRMKAAGMFSTNPAYKVLYSLSPPALFYQDGAMTEDVQFTREYDMDSDQTSPRFKDGFFKFSNAEDSESLALIIEVRNIVTTNKVRIVSAQATSLWGAIPIFRKKSQYVDSGCHCVPLFEGRVPSAALSASDVYDYITGELKKGKKDSPVKLMHGASVILRLVDGSVDEFEKRSTKSTEVNKKYIDLVCSASAKGNLVYDYSPETYEIKKPLSKIMGSEEDTKALNVAMAEATGIKHYIFS